MTIYLRLRRLAVAASLAVAVLLSTSCDEAEERAHGEMFDEVALWVWHHGYEEGDWDPDWEDAPFYGPALYARWGWETGNPEHQERAREAVAYNLAVAEAGLDDLLGVFVDQASTILYGTLGVIEYMDASGDRSQLEQVDEVVENAGGLIQLMGDYITGFEDNYAVDAYGPTSISAIFALLYLQHAVLLETERAPEYVERARQILARIDALAYNGEFYLFSPERPDELYLYPNVAMMLASVRMYQATGEASYLERAESIYEAIQALRCPDRPGYRSPYSAEVMGAQSDDYTTLSSTNYLMLALALLADETGDPRYRAEIEELLGFVEDYLWVPGDGQVYHHWMDGRLAIPEDPEYYCVGCNLQLLYITWWVEANLQ